MNDLLLRALRNEPVERPPVWYMRQAGRYLPEYHTVRNSCDGFLDLCRTPEKAAEVTLQPLRRFPLDASIVFNDILVPPAAMGLDLEFVTGRGPVFRDPLRSVDDLGRLKTPSIERDMPHVLKTIEILVGQLDVPLFGFAGAPYTLAAYMIEGGGSKEFHHVKAFMHHHPKAFIGLLDRLADICRDYLQAQVEAGCAAVQLFDTWAGDLSHEDFRRFALPAARKALQGIDAPRLYFTRNCAPYLRWLPEVEADAYALDWRVDIAQVRQALGPDVPVMGNLDPIALFGPEESIREQVHGIIRAAGPTGHIFNLGHGVGPKTPIPGVQAMVDAVRSWRWT